MSLLFCSVCARSKSVRASCRAARALATSGTRSTSNVAPPARPSRASICAALAWASRAWASTSAAAMRTRSPLAVTRLPRSTGVATTRPAISAATSAWSWAASVPLTRMNRAIGAARPRRWSRRRRRRRRPRGARRWRRHCRPRRRAPRRRRRRSRMGRDTNDTPGMVTRRRARARAGERARTGRASGRPGRRGGARRNCSTCWRANACGWRIIGRSASMACSCRHIDQRAEERQAEHVHVGVGAASPGGSDGAARRGAARGRCDMRS